MMWEPVPPTVSAANDFILAPARISPSRQRGFHPCASKDISLAPARMLGVVSMENRLAELSMDFAVHVLKTTEHMKGHYSLTNQLERSATSIGANIREAKYAHSKSDFIAKLQIALKECYETEYWLELMMRASLCEKKEGTLLLHDCGSLRRMLIASLNTAKGRSETAGEEKR